MQDIINLIMNNGIGIVCVAYLIYFQSTTMKELSITMREMSSNLSIMNERLTKIESKLE